MSSEAQIAANRNNAKSSTGPRSDEGKQAVRHNGLKHGLAGAGKVLPPSIAADAARSRHGYHIEFEPATPFEDAMVLRLAVVGAQLNAASRRILLDADDNVRNAHVDWIAGRRRDAKALGAGIAADPRDVVIRLQRTSHGCQWLLARWGELLEALRTAGRWDEPQYLLAHQMSGLSLAHLSEADPVVVADAEVARLEALDEEVWEKYDGPHYARAEARALWDTSKHGELLRRYERAADREFFKLAERLIELRKQRHDPFSEGFGGRPDFDPSSLEPRDDHPGSEDESTEEYESNPEPESTEEAAATVEEEEQSEVDRRLNEERAAAMARAAAQARADLKARSDLRAGRENQGETGETSIDEPKPIRGSKHTPSKSEQEARRARRKRQKAARRRSR